MTVALTAPPSLLPMYARAALGALPVPGLKRGGGSQLPDSSYTLADQSIDRAHLRAYQYVCGFGTSDVLPPTYLHVLAFPVAVKLMTEPNFPFPLIGLVHVENSIAVRRAVRADEAVSFAVHVGDLRDHHAGRQFDVLVDASVAGETVWSARSTYLRRGAGSGSRERREAVAPNGVVSLVRVPDDIGRRYAAVSGDRNPIHLHALTAKAFGFKSAIAHGMWLKARTLAALEGRLPDAFTVDVAFKTPVFLPSTVALAADRSSTGWTLDVRDAKSGKPHLAGSVSA